MKQPPRFYRLGDHPTDGLVCDDNGLSLGGTPLLVRAAGRMGLDEWRLRPLANINRDLSLYYGFPIDVARKFAGICAVARALDAGRRGAGAVHRTPSLLSRPAPDLSKAGDIAPIATAFLALELQASGLHKRDWDPSLHPRHGPPASPDSTGGELAPGGAVGGQGTASVPPIFDIPFEDLAAARAANDYPQACPSLRQSGSARFHSQP